jgi:Mg2+ and Co2+ transporter CorA
VGLHNISKHISHLIESSSALVATADQIHKTSRSIAGIVVTPACQQTTAELIYQKELLATVGLRLKNLEKRLQNLVNLAFNLVTQTDSKVLQRDSDSMKTIAAVTLLFLPMSTIAVSQHL